MAEVFGYEGFQYEYVPDWPKLPEGYALHECPGVAVDSKDNVYLLTRGEHPLMQFDREGNFIKSFGEGWFSKNRTHGLYIAHDDTLLVADDGIHTIQQFSPDGELLLVGAWDTYATVWNIEGTTLKHRLDHFADVVSHGEEPFITAEDGRRALILAAAAHRSATTGAPVPIRY